MRLVICLMMLHALATTSPAQSPVRLKSFGFGAGVALQPRIDPGAQLTASVILDVRDHSYAITIGSASGEFSGPGGQQRDAFISASRAWRIPNLPLFVTAGMGLHSLQSRVGGAPGNATLSALEREHSGLRPSLEGTAAFDLPLAPNGAAGLQLLARGAVMRHVRQLSIGVGVRLSPGNSALRFGEEVTPAVAPADASRSWQSVVEQVMLLEGRLPALDDVVASQNGLLIRFAPVDSKTVNEAVSVIARVLHASTQTIYLTINAPEPEVIAAAVTAGGFPAERITHVVTARDINLQATRQAPAAPIRSEQP
jgi:hypothetical protein